MKKLFLYLLLIGMANDLLFAQVSISIYKPSGTANALLAVKGSTRRLFVKIDHGTLNTATFTTSDPSNSTLTPSPHGNWVDVQVGNSSGKCPMSGSRPFRITSTKTFTVTATSNDDPSKSDTQTVFVCSPTPVVTTVPFYRTAYSGQLVELQGQIRGTSDQTGTWAITSQPAGGDGAFVGTNANDAVFQARVAGRYKVTWSPKAGAGATSYSTIYVTGHPLPSYAVTPNGTEPIDCTVDAAMKGKVYDVGSGKSYADLEAIPWNAVGAGSTIRLFNTDSTGKSPSTYPEWIQITTRAGHDQPVRLCGVPDALGNLPVMEGANATGRADVLSAQYVSGAAGVYVYNHAYSLYPNYEGPQFVIVEGIKFHGYSSANKYCPAGQRKSLGECSVSTVSYGVGAAGFRFQQINDGALIGVESSGNDNGVFSESNASNGWSGVSFRVLYEGNNVHDNGATGNYSCHNWYLQDFQKVVQFNQTPSYNTAALGSLYKDRASSIVRYNYFGTGAAREQDFVEDQDAIAYLDPNQYLTEVNASPKPDAFSGDDLAGMQEMWHNSVYNYGNTYAQATGNSVHFHADNIGGVGGRLGNLWWFNNTMLATSPKGNYRYAWFDTGDNGNNLPHAEWPSIYIYNNVLDGWTNAAPPFFSWNSQTTAFLNFGKNVIPKQWGTNVQTCADNSGGACDGTGWPFATNSDAYTGGQLVQRQLSGVTNLVTASSPVFDHTTYALTVATAGMPLPSTLEGYPVRFNYSPASKTFSLRSTTVSTSVGGVIGAIDASSASTSTSSQAR